LSIDGGGIHGIFPAAILAGLEQRYIGGNSIAGYFDLVAGTSTGGILALGLGAGYTSKELLELYVIRGCEIFPPFPATSLGRLKSWLQSKRHYVHYRYDRRALERLLTDRLGARLFGDSRVRLVIPAFEGRHSEVFVFKTPHHPDYRTDRFEKMVTVGLATAAAPTYFRPLEHNGYVLVDGGVWSNNPILLAVLEALICFDVSPDRIDVLSLGCGDDKYIVSRSQITLGGLWQWKSIIEAAMRLQSLAATNQVRLLLGPGSVIRFDAPTFEPKIPMDDWERSVTEFVPAADVVLSRHGEQAAKMFLAEPAAPFVPLP
jgi:patatin-like phospholipase/acyl hydrolase